MTHVLATYNDDTGKGSILKVELGHTETRNADGKARIAYIVSEGDKILARGDDFYPSPLRNPKGLQAACDLVVLLGLGSPEDDKN
jgi:hypothetical protein